MGKGFLSVVELRHLRYLSRWQESCISDRAAERVGIAQLPLSKQIQQLEDEIGVKLFKRSKRRGSLTHAGKIFLNEARQTIDLSERAVRLAQRADRGEVGRLVVGFVGSATYSFLPYALRSFRTRFPHVELVLRELTTYRTTGRFAPEGCRYRIRAPAGKRRCFIY